MSVERIWFYLGRLDFWGNFWVHNSQCKCNKSEGYSKKSPWMICDQQLGLGCKFYCFAGNYQCSMQSVFPHKFKLKKRKISLKTRKKILMNTIQYWHSTDYLANHLIYMNIFTLCSYRDSCHIYVNFNKVICLMKHWLSSGLLK